MSPPRRSREAERSKRCVRVRTPCFVPLSFAPCFVLRTLSHLTYSHELKHQSGADPNKPICPPSLAEYVALQELPTFLGGMRNVEGIFEKEDESISC